jgi:hypothetical protein
MARHVAHHLAPAHREADERGIARHIEMIQHIGQIVGECIVIIAARGLLRPAKAAPVIGDGLKTGIGQTVGNRVPAVARQGPAVDQDDRAAMPPGLGEKMGAIAGFDHVHSGYSRSIPDAQHRWRPVSKRRTCLLVPVRPKGHDETWAIPGQCKQAIAAASCKATATGITPALTIIRAVWTKPWPRCC